MFSWFKTPPSPIDIKEIYTNIVPQHVDERNLASILTRLRELENISLEDYKFINRYNSHSRINEFSFKEVCKLMQIIHRYSHLI